VHKAESCALNSAFSIMRCPSEDTPATKQIALPLGHGGLELQCTCVSEGCAAYLAAAARAQIAKDQQPFTLSAALVGTFSNLCGPCCATRLRGYGALTPSRSPARALGQSPTLKGSSVHTPLPIALTPSYKPLMPPPPMASARARSYSAIPADRHQLGSTPCPSPELSSSKVASSHSLAASPGYQCDACQRDAPATLCTCGSRISGASTDHSLRCSALAAQTTLRHHLFKGILRRAVQQAGIASPLEPTLRHLPGLTACAALLQMAWLSVLGLGVTSSLPCRPASLSPMSRSYDASTLPLSISSQLPRPHQEQRWHVGTSKCGWRMGEWSLTGTPLSPMYGTGKESQARTPQQPMLICRNTHASPEPRPTGLCKHSQTCTVHINIFPFTALC
jgi:hypothetical protein